MRNLLLAIFSACAAREGRQIVVYNASQRQMAPDRVAVHQGVVRRTVVPKGTDIFRRATSNATVAPGDTVSCSTKSCVSALLAMGLAGCASSAPLVGMQPTRLAGEPVWHRPASGDCSPPNFVAGTTCTVCDLSSESDCERACADGNGHACVLAAGKYESGFGTVDDPKHSFQLNERGCELGSAMGCEHLALQLHSGEGGVRDEKRALTIDHDLCREGRGSACAHAGEAFIAGRGASQDGAYGVSLLRQGCARGAAEACRLLRDPRTLTDVDAAVRSAREQEVACQLHGDAQACASAEPPSLKQD